MSVITNLNPTTELEALNAMLGAIGEAPVASLDDPRADVQMALNTLRNVTRAVQARRWRFNTEFGYALEPAGIVTQGGRILNVFVRPDNLLSFRVSATEEQRGVDAILRPSRVYTPKGTLVFANRLTGEDGWDRDTLRIDPVWAWDFEQLPETARRYITVYAARQFQQQVLGNVPDDPQALGFSQRDEEIALSALVADQSENVAPLISEGGPNTELDAINRMLVAVGLNPEVSLQALQSKEAVVALNTLRAVSRAVQVEGWRFNTELGLEIPADGTLDWTDTAGQTIRLNVFVPPEGLLRFDLTPHTSQVGLDVAIRPSKKYQGGGVPVFYDRALNRDGFDAWRYGSLYIDAVTFVAFQDLPESAREYIIHLAAHQFAQQVGAEKLTEFTQDDLARALRIFELDQGDERDYNILNTLDARRKLGGRPLHFGGALFDYISPTHD